MFAELGRTNMGWEEVVAAIASMASEYMKGEAVNKQFANLEDAISNMIERAVERIEQFVVAAIDKNAINDAQNDIRTCFDLLIEWENAPADLSRLQTAKTQSLFAINRLHDFDWKQLEAYGDAASVRLLALVVAARLDVNEWTNMIAFRETAIRNATQWYEDGKKYFQGLIDGVTALALQSIDEHHWGSGHADQGWEWVAVVGFSDNGRPVQVSASDLDRATAANRAHSKCSDLRQEVLAGRQKIFDGYVGIVGAALAQRIAAWKAAGPPKALIDAVTAMELA
jgi:hypothetical protein